MQFTDCGAILDPSPLHLEMGFERSSDGVLHVACRTDLPGCTGEMFEWWFRSRPDTARYLWWHPIDHISSHWIEAREGTHVGSIHVVEERLTHLEPQQLSIQFIESTEVFDPAAYAQARSEKRITAAICGRIAVSHEPARDEQGRVLGGRLIHTGRDTAWGCTLRSHFYLGQDLPLLGYSPQQVTDIFPDEMGKNLLQHCYDEFTFLSRVLPSIYIAENRNDIHIPRPW